MTFTNIQSLRAIAAILVLCAHLGGIGRFVPEATVVEGLSWAVFGVDIFFVISGFIIAHVTSKQWGNGLEFLALRAIRIYPLYWLAILVYIGVPRANSYSIQSLLLLPVLNADGSFYPILDVGWTLIFEMFFYACVAASMALPKRFMVATVIGLLATSHIASYMMPDGAWKVFFGHTIQFEFCIGIGVWKLSKMAMDGRLISVLAVAAICCFLFVPSGEPTRVIAYGFPAGVVLLTALWLEEKGLTSPRFLTYLGDASFAIYLTHPITLMKIAPSVGRSLSFLDPISVWFAIGAVSVAVGVATYALIDGPGHRLLKRLCIWFFNLRLGKSARQAAE
ncbi:acyltransferase [Agrobacterium sp. AGB01]|uniref:acyltransferase family protein n=1 Tax=Agrobacterium sp. AGB01 TaxID=2769302 RepID=UPI00177F8B88|nr:acyltransferase [Agrobacterium sp. AGB01]MBD9387150.1 acyltransferase [Agrobacterium sp. AGB01]